MNDFQQARLRRIQRERSDTKVAKILKYVRNAETALTADQISERTGIHAGHVRTVLSSTSSSDDRYKCEYGNFPIIRIEEKALSENSNRLISLYSWNYEYGREPK